MIFQIFIAFLVCVSDSLAIPPVATSHQSMVSGDGYRYSYGIVHGPPGIGHAVGESYPHGYGGFGTYAPSYGYEGYGLGHGLPHSLEHISPSVIPHTPVAHIPVVSKPIAPIAPIPLEFHKPLAPTPIISKPLVIPFSDYVLSAPEHHYGYGVPHHGITHLENSLYDGHYAPLAHGIDGHLPYSSSLYGHGDYSFYKPSFHSYF